MIRINFWVFSLVSIIQMVLRPAASRLNILRTNFNLNFTHNLYLSLSFTPTTQDSINFFAPFGWIFSLLIFLFFVCLFLIESIYHYEDPLVRAAPDSNTIFIFFSLLLLWFYVWVYNLFFGSPSILQHHELCLFHSSTAELLKLLCKVYKAPWQAAFTAKKQKKLQIRFSSF